MPMSKAQVKHYNQQFEAEMAAMSVSECRRWNPHMTVEEAEQRIAKAKAVISKGTSCSAQQEQLF